MVREYDLVIVGAGSGNMLPLGVFDDWKIAIVESDRMGGTCLNRGCIPSKCFVYTADVAEHIHNAGRFDIDARLNGVDWQAIRDRVFARIDPLHQSAVDYRRANGVDVYLDAARFVGERTLVVGDEEIRGEQVVVAAGSRPFLPSLPGLKDVPHHTSDTIMRIDELPDRLIILGGGYVAVEMAHIFGSLGVDVTIVNRGERLLSGHDREIAHRFTELASKRFDVRLNSPATGVVTSGDAIRLELTDGFVEGDTLLVAAGRVANTDELAVSTADVALDEHGHVLRDEYGKTSAPGVWTLGDISNHFQLKHVANAEAEAVWHNIANPTDLRKVDLSVVPAAVFTGPQIATVGETEEQLISRNARYVKSVKPYGETAYGWALEDTTSFVKVLADRDTRRILGAHIMGPEASLLLQPLVQAMALGNTADQLAKGVMYPHPALSEVIEQALLELPPA